MTAPLKQNKEEPTLTPKQMAALEKFLNDVKTGKIVPFEEQTKKAREDLKRAGLIK